MPSIMSYKHWRCTLPRAAGDSDKYTFKLSGGKGEIKLPSVTSIIKTVMSGSFGSASYWGFNLGLDYAENLFGSPINRDEAKKSPFAPNNKRDSAAGRGTATHDVLERLAKGQELDGFEPSGWQKGVIKWWDGFSKWAAEAEATVYSEQVVWSLLHRFAGTADLIVETPAEVLVVDLKTHSGAPRFEDMVQTAAYGLAWKEMQEHEKRTRTLVVCAHEDGGFKESKEKQEVRPETFLNLLEVYKEMKK